MKTIKNIFLLVLSLAGGYLLGRLFSTIYLNFFPGSGGSFIDGRALIALPLNYIFSIFVLFTAFGDSKKYWWIGILLLPAILFELYFDLIHIYFPIVVGLAGWGLGLGVEKVVAKLKKP